MKKKNGKQGRSSRDNPIPPSVMDSYPSQLAIDSDQTTDLSTPTDEAVKYAKRWMNLNVK